MADSKSRADSGYSNEEVLRYLSELHAPHDGPLAAAFNAPEREGMPAIQVGPLEGRTVGLLMQLVSAKRVVEIGTLAGYSALWIARALSMDGTLFTIEADPKHAEVAQKNVALADLSARVRVLTGDAKSVLRDLESEGPFDAVFIDADKESYDHYGLWAARNTRKGGLLLGDNAYFFGRLLESSDGANAMRRFHEDANQYYHTTCIPTPDGLLLGIRNDQPAG